MKRLVWPLRIIAIAVTIGCGVAFVPWDLCFAYLAPLPATVQEQVDDATRHGLDAVIVYVDQPGKAPAVYASGWKDRAARVPAYPHALFKIASISKLYIAAATTKLVAARRLSLDDTLAHLLPELSGRIQNADRITLRMLLRHRSGIPNFIDEASFRWDEDGNPTDALNLVLDKSADFAPDSRYEYSNTNYLLIGRILDKTLGHSHQDYIKTEILTPLKLSHTFGQLSEVNPADVASGYVVGLEGDMKPLDFTVPGGSMIATAEDVGVFLRALKAGSLLTREEQAIYSSVYVYEHTGLLPGYESVARYHKDTDTVVVVFVSTSGANSWGKIDAIESRVARITRTR